MSISVAKILTAGLLATLAMDLVSHGLTLARVFAGPVNTVVIGRWFAHNLTGTWSHRDIATARPIPHEASIGTIAHYGIGVALALIYVLLLGQLPLSHSLPVALSFGLLTSALPWLWLFPACGFGFMGLRGDGLLLSSFVNHLVFGLGLYFSLGDVG